MLVSGRVIPPLNLQVVLVLVVVLLLELSVVAERNLLFGLLAIVVHFVFKGESMLSNAKVEKIVEQSTDLKAIPLG